MNHGNAWSLYFTDPEGNGLECFVDSPFHVTQPYADRLDLAAAFRLAVRMDLHEGVCNHFTLMLPGGQRFLQLASGYLATIVKGVTVREHDVDTGARPGRVARPTR